MNPDSQMVERMTVSSSAVLVLAIVAILVFSRTAEWRLLLIGIFMTIAASMQANISGFSINSGQMALLTAVGSTTLMRISVILTLSGIGMMLMSRVAPQAAAVAVKERPHGD